MDSEASAFFPYFYFSPRRARDLFSATRLSQFVTVLGHGHRSATAKSTITSLVHDSHRPKVKYAIECNET